MAKQDHGQAGNSKSMSKIRRSTSIPANSKVEPINAEEIRQATRELFDFAASTAASKCQQKAIQKMGDFLDKRSDHLTTLFEGLDKILPRPIPGIARAPRRLRDAEYIKISKWCELNNKIEWGRRPRTFVILHMIGCPEVLDGFVQENLSDIALPYTEENLPRVVKGSTARQQFLEYQNHVLTTYAADLERSGGKHQNVEGSADDFFHTIKDLGSGGFGHVDHVVGRLSLENFARKRIARGRSFNKDRDALRMFENELQALKLLSHRHLVKLIGSYTDRRFVGLIMTPVADMNFAVYLSQEGVDHDDRKNCLRRFFGCLATGVEYLHKMKIRHKDIKPENILVRDRQILLADFGTSHNWAADTHGTTTGTRKEAITPRYCAPEVVRHASRSTATDIWSLGCVFLEMSTVLSNLTVSAMRKFFQEEGTRGHFIRDNPVAAHAWGEELLSRATPVTDRQILELGRRMYNEDANERPTAAEIVSEILDFIGPPAYYGFCCDRNNDTCRSGKEATANTTMTEVSEPTELIELTEVTEFVEINGFRDQEQTENRMEDSRSSGDGAITNSSSKAVVSSENTLADAVEITNGTLSYVDPSRELGNAKDDETPTTRSTEVKPISYWQTSNYKQPAVADAENTTTMVHYPTSVKKTSNAAIIETTLAVSNSRTGAVQERHLEREEEHSNRLGVAIDHKTIVSRKIQCVWPLCKSYSISTSDENGRVDALRKHYRAVHNCHDFAWSALLAADMNRSGDLSWGKEWHALPLVHVPTESCFHEPGSSSHSTKPNQGLQSKTSTRVDGNLAWMSKQTSEKPAKTLRFDVLPGETKTKKVKKPKSWEEETTTSSQSDGNMRSSVRQSLWELVGESERQLSKSKDDRQSLPKSSLSPSYFLASTNPFDRAQIINRLTATGFTSSMPLFVYGSLMFPSILAARAQSYLTGEGVYSKQIQRRLKTDAADWARICISLRDVTRKMTPAVLRGYRRRKVQGFSCATLERDWLGDNADSDGVQGFLLFGLSDEALLCLDHLLNDNDSRAMFKDNNDRDAARYASFAFRRSYHNVQVDFSDDQAEVFSAVTYVWNGSNYLNNTSKWDISDFVRSRSFTKLSHGTIGKSWWVDEEEIIAKSIGIEFVLSGDALRDAVIQNDREGIIDLWGRGHDVNSPCHVFGYPLQAAAFHGKSEIVELLLTHCAKVNATGGTYRTALIAATVQGHHDVVRVLLRSGAEVLTDGGEYVSAIYQAVSFRDVDLAQILLEKGAWLTKDYKELLDLATETGSRDMIRLLQEYDARLLHLKPSEALDQSATITDRHRGRASYSDFEGSDSEYEHKPERQVAISARAVVQAVGWQILVLKGRKGKWTGIKGVQLVRAAVRAGVPDTIIDKIRPRLSTGQELLDFLTRAVAEHNETNQISGGKSKPKVRHSVTEYTTDSESRRIERDSRDRSRQQQVATLPHQNQRSDNYKDIFCLTCSGRGGRRGTERDCTSCRSSGRVPKRSRQSSSTSSSRTSRCKRCAGKGYVFSERDKCRDCAGSASDPAGTVDRAPVVGYAYDAHNEGDQPPPPYSSREYL